MRNIVILSLQMLIIAMFSNHVLAKDVAKVLGVSTKSDQLLFDNSNLSAKPNQTIKLTFRNTSAKGSGLQHNWVLVKPGKADSVSTASIAAGVDKGWLAESPDVIVHTKLLNVGESETLSFNAPSVPGDYTYLCTFPGHNVTMKGVLHIK